MERTTWGQINELFEAARRLPPGEREAWVRAATADERVQSEVLALLHAHEDDPWFVDDPGASRTPGRVNPAEAWLRKPTPVTPARTPPPAPDPVPAPTPPGNPAPTPSVTPRPRRAPEPKAGGQFAAYRLIREIFRGPARIVFEAVATGGSAHPRVALHVLAADPRDPAFAALLRAQGDVLSHLDHPGVPRLLDGGVTADGLAYLAFEFAAGDPIDDWCRERNLTARNRVDRVLAVCAAVQHAHEHLAAHGDLKPANILVSADGEVKVLDCGMAALLAFGRSPAGTPPPVHAYMSPEQARGEVLTTASDVFGLGLVLYTLLTGYPPYEVNGQAPARARHMICEIEPDLPSAIVGGRDRRQLTGALDRIVLKALSKNPRERYATAGALAADLRAWRDGLPASVSPATAWPRFGRGRSWGAVRITVASIVVIGLLAGAGYLGWQAYLLRGERDDARARLADAERGNKVLQERLAPPPIGELRLKTAAMTSDLALAERRGGGLAKAEALWAQSLSDVRPLLDPAPGDARALELVAAVRSSLGSLCRSQRRFEEALLHYREALRAGERASASPGAPAAAKLSLAAAQISVARLLLDLVEVRQPGPNDAARLREAGAMLAQAGPPVSAAAPESPAQRDAATELARQSDRLRRLASRRR